MAPRAPDPSGFPVGQQGLPSPGPFVFPTPAMPRILIIEDEPAIADTLVYALRSEHFETAWVQTGRDGLAAFARDGADCLVLDVGLPDASGFDVCKEVRAKSHVPVLFLTARDAEIDRVLGLELGADDYVVKPFSPRELVARVRALLRRAGHAGGVPAAPPRAADESAPLLAHDSRRMRILCRGIALPLTRNEYRLLAALLSAPGRVFTRDQLMEAAWDDPGAALDRTVDAHVKSARAKIRAAAPGANPIVTHRGLGYSLQEE